MKKRLLIPASWCLAAFILTGGGAAGWRNHRAIVRDRAERHRLEEAAQSDERSERGARSRFQMQASEDAARDFAHRLIRFEQEFLRRRERGELPTEESGMWWLDLQIEWDRLDAEQLKIVIAALHADTDLPGKNQTNLLSVAFMRLVEEEPVSGLEMALSPEWRGMIEGELLQVVLRALFVRVEKDPEDAVAWLRKHPEWDSQDTKRELVETAAKQDISRALQLAGELGVMQEASYGLVTAASPAEWLLFLAAFREGGANSSEAKSRDKIIDSIAQRLSDGGPTAAQGWLDQAALNETEALAFMKGIRNAQDLEHSGKWIDWAAARLPAKKISSDVWSITRLWAQRDYKAAGEWLNQTAEGPVKQTAVTAYAEAVASQDPETAGQWAVTLPTGKDRERLLRQIRDEWKKKDEAAAAEFARKNGL